MSDVQEELPVIPPAQQYEKLVVTDKSKSKTYHEPKERTAEDPAPECENIRKNETDWEWKEKDHLVFYDPCGDCWF